MAEPVMKVRDMELPVTFRVNRDGTHAWFQVTVNDQVYEAEDFEKLRRKVLVETKRPSVRVTVPALKLERDWSTDGWKFTT
jgi:hypothetical protein